MTNADREQRILAAMRAAQPGDCRCPLQILTGLTYGYIQRAEETLEAPNGWGLSFVNGFDGRRDFAWEREAFEIGRRMRAESAALRAEMSMKGTVA